MSVSVILPTRNEAAYNANTLRSVRAEKPQEILVVDGGSSDATCELARESAAPHLRIAPALVSTRPRTADIA